MNAEEAWSLIEQSLLPSEREDTREEFWDLLAHIWGEGADACHASEGAHPRNPYRNEAP